MMPLLRSTVLGVAIALAAPSFAASIDWKKVDGALGKPGTDQPGGVHKYALPRSDLHVTLDRIALKPGFALGGWLGFLPMGDKAMLMGDLVLLDSEISPVMKKLEESGVEITAVHNHLLRTSEPVYYMHVGGTGDPVKMAQALHAALALSKTPFESKASAEGAIDLDTAAIDKTLGAKGKASGGVYQISVPRTTPVKMEGMEVPPSLGTATSINFQPLGKGQAAITGDFVLTDKEVNPVLKALRENGIEVTALHSHMLGDEPHLYFMHFWAHGDAQRLARGLRAALDRTSTRGS
jgi:biotin operon repressor